MFCQKTECRRKKSQNKDLIKQFISGGAYDFFSLQY
jgi:hypothetical protein